MKKVLLLSFALVAAFAVYGNGNIASGADGPDWEVFITEIKTPAPIEPGTTYVPYARASYDTASSEVTVVFRKSVGTVIMTVTDQSGYVVAQARCNTSLQSEFTIRVPDIEGAYYIDIVNERYVAQGLLSKAG